MKLLPLAHLSFLAGFVLSPHSVLSDMDVTYGKWWKEFLSSPAGNSWFDAWNTLMQAKFDELSRIVEAQVNKTDSFRVLMVGDSTIKHQFGAMCAFLGESQRSVFDTGESQQGSPGCCIDTVEGGGRGLCFEYEGFRFLNPERAASKTVDAYYFGCGLHLLHMTPSWPGEAVEPVRVQEWLNYESLLQGTVEAVRRQNGPDVRIIFMTHHVVADDKFRGDYAQIRDAYRAADGNVTIRAGCEQQVAAAAADKLADISYFDWKGRMADIEKYTAHKLEGDLAVGGYCEEALMDRRGSLALNRRARLVMAKLGVPVVDGGGIVEGQGWASRVKDGIHYHPIVPLESIALVNILTSPRLLENEQTGSGDRVGNGPRGLAVSGASLT